MTEIKQYPVVTAPVLIPYAPDCEYQYGEEVLPPDKIKLLADSFQKYKIIDLQHEYTKRLINHQKPIQRGKLLNSYISEDELYLKGLDGFNRKYPQGTWIISVKITDPEAMKLYNKGQLTGFSVTVKERSHANAIMDYVSQKELLIPESVIESEKAFTKTPKRILMKDVKDPVAFTVSLVRQPCVYGAKFCRKSCLIVNKDKLKENTKSNMSLKDKIKAELNTFIDGLDVEEESVKEYKSEADLEELEEVSPEESKKEDDGTEGSGGNGGDSTTTGGDTTTTSGDTTTTTGEGENETETEMPTDNGGNGGTSQGKVKEAQKEKVTEEESEKCGGKESEKCKGKESKKCVNKESEKSVLYLAQEDVEDLIRTTLQRYAEEIEQMVFDGIQEALDDYEFAGSFKETPPKPEEPEKKEEDEQVEPIEKYATKEMVESIFEEQFSSFKSDLMGNIKKAQKESIKSYSKAINPESDGFQEESKKGYTSRMSDRDVYGRRLRKK